jgi:SRSO17 transposase
VLAIDESGVIKKGDQSAGVARQYCGVRTPVRTSGKVTGLKIGC